MLRLALKSLLSESVDVRCRQFCTGHTHDTNLIRRSFLDERWTDIVGAEMIFVHLRKDSVFGAKPHASSTSNEFSQ